MMASSTTVPIASTKMCIRDRIYARTADIKDAQIFAVAPPMISGYGTSTGFDMRLQDRMRCV